MYPIIKKFNDSRFIILVYLILESFLYASFIVKDLAHMPSNIIKYISICVCFIISLFLLLKYNIKLLVAAMSLTLFADTFLLLLDRYYVLGVAAFCIVQTLYAYRLIKQSRVNTVAVRGIVYLIIVLIAKVAGILDWLTLLSAWSFTQLTMNLIQGFAVRKRFGGGGLFAVAMLLFWCCDVCVGIYNMTSYIPSFQVGAFQSFVAFGMWLFYLPSQVMIVLSFVREKEHEQEGYTN